MATDVNDQSPAGVPELRGGPCRRPCTRQKGRAGLLVQTRRGQRRNRLRAVASRARAGRLSRAITAISQFGVTAVRSDCAKEVTAAERDVGLPVFNPAAPGCRAVARRRRTGTGDRRDRVARAARYERGASANRSAGNVANGPGAVGARDRGTAYLFSTARDCLTEIRAQVGPRMPRQKNQPAELAGSRSRRW